ncbi:hypothetical protein M655_024880 [Brevibacillus sp. NSP2.1]|uniref:hypothetical protein n=1 Tax=Brevibacillus sp. NSP2.1 TaxID=3003229 RepID=UPI00040FA6F1|nr:hypothetical protein [Brevibacillus sp. NSP2.1]QHZ58608.1 hypothetical protein M655_024880 [Brevibacillus sp. NSP2.1]
MGKLLSKSTGATAKESAWSMRTNVMYGLFDLGRLIIDDERKLHAFHNEIAALCNAAYDHVKRDVEERGEDEVMAIRGHFGVHQLDTPYDERLKPTSSLMAGLEELLTFMYGDGPESARKVGGFLQRAQAVIDGQFRAHYEGVAGGDRG